MRRRHVLRNALITVGGLLSSCTHRQRPSVNLVASPSPVSPASSDGSTGSDLLNCLQQGGYLIYFRHGEAVTGSRPNAIAALPASLQTCLEPERPLTERAVVEMRRMGETLRQLQIPVGRVLSSPACRCIETALYAFNTVEVDRNLAGLIDLVPEGKSQRIAALNQMLSTPPMPGTNTVLSAHISNIQSVIAGISLIQGEAAIILPREGTGFELIDQITPAAWNNLT
jgi:phosphohistidine phosphatase SixA